MNGDDQIFDDFDVFENIFQNQQQIVQKTSPKLETNLFNLTDEFRSNINRKLPKGFILIKKSEIPTNSHPFQGQIQYVPIQKQPKIASLQLLEKFPIPVLNQQSKMKKEQKTNQKSFGLRLGSLALPQGKSKQTQKVKGILQRFRKHPKYAILAQHLNKLGFLHGFAQIEAQFKKNIHTIDSFKDRCLYILNHAKKITFAESTIEVINQLIDQFMFQVEQARKIQFQTNLQNIQKNVDKITREITDIKESGNWYVRKKKKSQKNYDEKQIMYITDLVKKLPTSYLIGVWQIVQEKPFFQSGEKQLSIDFSTLKTKKLRQIQYFVKRKLSAYYRSRERKRQKILRKKMEKQSKQVKNQEDERKSLDFNKSNPKQQDQAQNQMKDQKEQGLLDQEIFVGKYIQKSQSKAQKQVKFIIDQDEEVIQTQKKHQIKSNQIFIDKNEFFQQMMDNQNMLSERVDVNDKETLGQTNINENRLTNLNSQFQLASLNYNAPLVTWNQSSDSSMITDEEDSQF